MKDTIFETPISKQFEFDADVAAVFDDMLERSVPFYKTSQEMTKSLILAYVQERAKVYDLGCSTATLLLECERSLRAENREVELIGIDNAEAMLDQARKKIEAFGSAVSVLNGDILEFSYDSCDVMVSNYTLQFIRPLIREALVEKIAKSLKEKGVFIFSEKVISDDKVLNKKLIDIYYNFKKEQGYSTYEIMQKREALENVLVPYSEAENIKMAKRNGFSHCEVVFRWANFATFIAIK
ncbi:MAG: carboxy-S-adenosyl-L-methionine synthase CmoA [Campylobacterota bacterium]|nr:carboxy-S-adenosyl-L-methionine synthase CmoA [Campylobacterota bacterium]